MKVLVTGSRGFIGKNLLARLSTIKDMRVSTFTRDNTLADLEKLTKDCDFIFHLAGVTRPKNECEFFEGNVSLTKQICENLEKSENRVPILFTSSEHAKTLSQTPYGASKLQEEEILHAYGKANGVNVYIYRLPHLFGRWSLPNYNNVTATWCYNISHGLDIFIDVPKKVLPFCYIDDAIHAFIDACYGNQAIIKGFCYMEPIYEISLKELSDALYFFKDNANLKMEELESVKLQKLYKTYLSYLRGE